jgi:ferredoxin
MKANIFFGYLRPSERRGGWGRVYRALERIGPATRSSPVRRASQLVCLGLFLYGFFYVCWPYAVPFTENTFASKAFYPVEMFLLLDPLVGISTALAARHVEPMTLAWLAFVLVLCVLVPRAFCGYLCPLGTLIDGFDWLIGRHLRRFHLPDNGPKGGWVHAKYYILAAVLCTSAFGVLSSGYVAAIPVLTRGLLLTGGRVQLGALKGANHLPPFDWTVFLSVLLFAGVFLVSALGRRFWCRYLCPSGAIFSVANFFRVGERKVEDTCINCNKCVEVCPFDAIKEDFTTRTNDCTYCQTCGGVCPTDAIKFVTRWNDDDLKLENESVVETRPVSRRNFVAAAGLGLGAALFVRGGPALASSGERPLRPPGSVVEDDFLDLCIRCGKCFTGCPGPVLQPAGLEYGLESLWTPVAVLDHAGCHPDCNFCTQVCPTGAIQPLDLPTKRQTHMGLAKVNLTTCLPLREQDPEPCDLCFTECREAGYDAITLERRALPVDVEELARVGFSSLEIDSMAHIDVPVVAPDQCVGCGICQNRCHKVYVKQEGRLSESAIVIVAENEDRGGTRT